MKTRGDASLQESPERKAAWLAEAQVRLPVASRVRVVASDVEDYVGFEGVVVGYDVGTSGAWPLVQVRLADGRQDSFYSDGNQDDEIVRAGGGWVSSRSEEHWSMFDGYESRAVAEAHAPVEQDLKPGDTFYTGFARLVDYAELNPCGSGEDLVERAGEAAYDNWGWEEAFDEVSRDQMADLEKVMDEAFKGWLKKHNLQPTYYQIDDVQKHVVPVSGDVVSEA